jgi:FOG: HPt domain
MIIPTHPNNTDFLSVPVLDLEKALSRVHHKKDLLKRVIDIFIQGLSEKTDLIEKEIKNQNWESLGILAHSLKGSSWTIGAQQLGDIAFAMEKASEKKDMIFFHHLFQIFKESVHRFLEHGQNLKL